MGENRGGNRYWKDSVIFDSDLASLFSDFLPNLRIVGLDAISIASLHDPREGVHIHEALLSKDIRIVEDMHLSDLDTNDSIKSFYLVPHIVDSIDASPVTAIVELDLFL